MVKTRKMSKTSIAVIVLSVLLVLSLVMGMTGAWFTDKKSDDKSATISFGQIAITAGATAITGNAWADVLPGDNQPISGSVATVAGSEGMYVLVTPTCALKDGSNALALVTASGGSTAIMTVTFAPVSSSGWTEVTVTGEGANAVPAGSKLYYVAKDANAQTLNLSGNIHMEETTKNIAYNGTTPVDLNISEKTLTVEFSVQATAVQARNIVATEGASITNAELGTILTEIGTYANVQAAQNNA